MIRAIAFDAYGTLFDVYSIGRLAAELFPGKGQAVATLWRDKQIEYTRLRTICGRYADFWTVTQDALAYTCERLSLPLDEPAQERLMGEYARLQAYPENRPALERLKATGLPLAILSNGTPAMLASAVHAAGMDGLFDHLLSVDTVRRFKTAPEAYQLGPDAFGCPAGEILFVSSNNWDVCGAAWFGYPTFWINRQGLPAERLGVSPTATGRTMDDVVTFALSR
ncbi:MAG TPA: haloacid dehalogenase type II [Geminicoccus sp.]|jgi:2-haloacid dehalogenase|uniref:haloacid dehalogenase type II n=1 Tax=Geminicoccus sp. TaxID=2024832 RepID=UPI002E3048B2|nr:haloacid dehalogenase type II [Geminicoccus sp.]HEX2529458.1 haloacid dehalogenase type II [Geminicoccus sp.]